MRLRRPSYSAIAATLALVLSMSGGALAASHYLITSTKQISPKVLGKLKGNRGPAGPRGATGPQGPQGPAGANGAQGPAGTNGADGATLGLNDFNDGPTHLNAVSGEQVIATMPGVPAGSYILTAKLILGTGPTGGSLPCFLRAGTDFDESSVLLAAHDAATEAFTLSHTFASTGPVRLTCDTQGIGLVEVDDAKISAIQVQNLVRSSQ